MYKKILVAVDGSATSDLALDEAVRLALDQEAQLRIVHALDQVALVLDTPYVLQEFLDAARKAGEEILERARARAREAGVEAETRLSGAESFGERIAALVNNEALEWPADLIVIGTHGRRGFSNVLMGSVAMGVVRTATVPVLLVRGG
jgi:nucleotide-binding universal stress UspA family protein